MEVIESRWRWFELASEERLRLRVMLASASCRRSTMSCATITVQHDPLCQVSSAVMTAQVLCIKSRVIFVFLFIFGESDDVTSLYPHDRFVTGKWDTRQFIDMYRESSKEVWQMLVNVTFFDTRHILIILIVQKHWRLLSAALV